MNDLEFTFEESLWDLTLASLKAGDSLSASRFLALMEGEDEGSVEDAMLDMEEKRVMLDVSDLPKFGGGEAAVRLRREEQLVKQGALLKSLDENDPLRLYLEELAMIPVCGDVQLWAEKCAAGSEAAREQLLNLSLSRVVSIAEEMVGRGVLLLDLIQEGSLGLWQAIQNYTSGDFGDIRDWWIRASMAKVITMQARQNGVGQKLRRALEDYKAVDERLLGDLGRNATIEEIAEELHMIAEEAQSIKMVLESARMVNRAKTENEPKEETEDDERHVEDTAFFQMRQRIMELLSGLSEADAKLLTLRFGLEGGAPLSPEEVGRKLGLTPEEVVAKEAKALAQLRNN